MKGRKLIMIAMNTLMKCMANWSDEYMKNDEIIMFLNILRTLGKAHPGSLRCTYYVWETNKLCMEKLDTMLNLIKQLSKPANNL